VSDRGQQLGAELLGLLAVVPEMIGKPFPAHVLTEERLEQHGVLGALLLALVRGVEPLPERVSPRTNGLIDSLVRISVLLDFGAGCPGQALLPGQFGVHLAAADRPEVAYGPLG